MLDFIRVASAVPPVTVGDTQKNAADICQYIRRADEAGCDLVVFPELALTGYTCADLFFQHTLLAESMKGLQTIMSCSALHPAVTAVVGTPAVIEGQMYNCAAVVSGGVLHGLVTKTHLPNYGEFSERRWFSSSEDLQTNAVTLADLGLPGTDIVPVGIDQKQHVELARDIAERFNQVYGETFTVPEPYILQTGKKIQSLAEPEKKMSKSDPNPNAFVGILDPRDVIIKKFKRAVTDSDTCVRYADGKDGINNLMTIYSCFTGKTMEEIEREFEGKGYGDFKLAVGETCADALAPIQTRYNTLMSEPLASSM